MLAGKCDTILAVQRFKFIATSGNGMSEPFSTDRLTSTIQSCRLVVLQDQLQECPYLSNQVARMPLQLATRPLDHRATDELLACGYRRTGIFVYRTQCPQCQACEPTRIDLARFQFSSSMRRVLRRADQSLHYEWGPPQVDPRRVELFNQHRHERGLDRGDRQVNLSDYQSFLTDSCFETMELAVYEQQKLIAVAIVDVGETSMSAVYTLFDPAASRYSLGTYAILKQIQWGWERAKQYLYLGLYVAENEHLNYKARFMPQQRYISGRWCDLE